MVGTVVVGSGVVVIGVVGVGVGVVSGVTQFRLSASKVVISAVDLMRIDDK